MFFGRIDILQSWLDLTAVSSENGLGRVTVMGLGQWSAVGNHLGITLKENVKVISGRNSWKHHRILIH